MEQRGFPTQGELFVRQKKIGRQILPSDFFLSFFSVVRRYLKDGAGVREGRQRDTASSTFPLMLARTLMPYERRYPLDDSSTPLKIKVSTLRSANRLTLIIGMRSLMLSVC